MSLRRAIAWASVAQYAVMAVSFVAMLVMARLLTPAEFGVAALGAAILGIAEAIRELAGGNFIIAEQNLTSEKIRSTMTVNLLATLVIVAVLMVLADTFARFFAAPALVPFLSIAMLGFLLGPMLYPQQALLSRDMSFDKLAIVTLTSSIASAATSILLAYLGFSSLSLAWGTAASSLVATTSCLAIRQDASFLRLSLRQWRAVVGFGIHSSVFAALWRINDALPMFIFGKLLDPARMAIMQRALTLGMLPEKTILSIVGAIALPAFSQQGREGADLKAAYLGAIALISAVHWPMMVLLAILTRPVVEILLGQQWLETVPLLHIICPALMFMLPISLQYPVLVAAGGVHMASQLIALQTGAMAVALATTGGYGLNAAAWGILAVSPFNAALSLLFVHSRIRFCWRDLILALGGSAIITLATAAGPITIMHIAPAGSPWVRDVMALALAGVGWVFGLYIIGHLLWRMLASTTRGILQKIGLAEIAKGQS
jgi:O-antigen/teichoic acid export membrane protein